MGSVRALYRRAQELNIDKAIDVAFDQSKEDLLEFNKEQLLEGKNNKGENITPSYLDDPYFKTREAAQRYSDWKDRITPNSKRQRGTPNLYIDGTFHRSVTVTVVNDKIEFFSSFAASSDIHNKYDSLYGLGGEIKREFIVQKLAPRYIEQIRQMIKI